MALAPKSNSSYLAIDSALSEVRTGPARSVPNHLRDRHRPGAESYGTYRYPHDYPGAVVEQRYLPDGIEHGAFWQPSQRSWEAAPGPDEVPGDLGAPDPRRRVDT
jgi:putative ATPase